MVNNDYFIYQFMQHNGMFVIEIKLQHDKQPKYGKKHLFEERTKIRLNVTSTKDREED